MVKRIKVHEKQVGVQFELVEEIFSVSGIGVQQHCKFHDILGGGFFIDKSPDQIRQSLVIAWRLRIVRHGWNIAWPAHYKFCGK
jgi:hypothetical protein